jgi:uncharacterized protein (DUF1697 family)
LIAYAAFLRGVSPMNLRMADLTVCLEAARFDDVDTVLSSGNAVFRAAPASDAAMGQKVEAAIRKHLNKEFMTIVRRIDALARLVEDDPFARYKLPRAAKRVVTFLNEERPKVKLPSEVDGARILGVKDREVFTAYVPGAKGPVFMTLIERTFGKDVTTRTWDTVQKVVKRGSEG